MKKLYIFIVTITFTFYANAQFSGDYDPANWTLTGVSPNSDASVDTSGAPSTITFYGNDSDFGDCCDLSDDYSVTVATTGYISFAYDFDNPDIEEFYYVINGTPTFITLDTETGAVDDIPVTAGDVFAFRIYTDDDCCGRGVAIISAFSFDVTLGTQENNLLSSEIKLYPSSNDGIFNMSYSGISNLKQLSVHDLSGKFIQEVNLENFNNNKVIDFTNLSKGLYLVTIESSKSFTTKKLVIK
jgi:hypothetical protein